MKSRFWLSASIALALGGCDFAPRYTLPSMALSAKFKDATAEGAPLPANEDWWRAFHDATLDNLQAEVEAANPDLAAAIAANAAEQARAQAALVRTAARMPMRSAMSPPTSSRTTGRCARRTSRPITATT